MSEQSDFRGDSWKEAVSILQQSKWATEKVPDKPHKGHCPRARNMPENERDFFMTGLGMGTG